MGAEGARKQFLISQAKGQRLISTVYFVVLFYFLFFSEEMGRTYSERAYHYNLIPFHEILRFIRARAKLGFVSVFLNIGGNIIGFLPFGFFLPVITRKLRHAPLVILLGFLTSAAVEFTQLFTHTGSFDVDDMILNTFGTAVGYLIYIIFEFFWRKTHDRR